MTKKITVFLGGQGSNIQSHAKAYHRNHPDHAFIDIGNFIKQDPTFVEKLPVYALPFDNASSCYINAVHKFTKKIYDLSKLEKSIIYPSCGNQCEQEMILFGTAQELGYKIIVKYYNVEICKQIKFVKIRNLMHDQIKITEGETVDTHNNLIVNIKQYKENSDEFKEFIL